MDLPAIPLTDLEVLAVDCQTTGATPRTGRLLEVGWAVARPSADLPVRPQNYLVRSFPEEDLAPAIAKLTGLQAEDTAGASSAREVWQRLAQTAGEVGRRSGGVCIAVIHYARFEKTFLQHWHAESAPDTSLPFEILCTHELARKLLPELPRCGLRALAGYFGLRLPAEKRCAPHVAATILIWDKLVGLLADLGIDDLSGLRHWMRSTPRPGRQSWIYPMPPHLPRQAPERPGVYRFRRSNGELLYVGKAKSLKRRIGSYFQQRRHSEHILEMLTQAVDLDYTTTATALEAALQEAEDIHRLRPEYNIHLQTGGRVPVYSTRDFQSAGEASPDRPMGPFPSHKALQPFSALVRYLRCPAAGAVVDDTEIATDFDRPVDAMPTIDVFYEGLALFRRQYNLPQEATSLVRRLLLLAAEWWGRARGAKGRAESESESDNVPQTDWQPAEVVNFLEGVARQGAHLARRGRWFTLLCEATLAWETTSGAGVLAAVTVRGGRVVPTAPPAHPAALLPPETHGRTPCRRRTSIDGATYLRMRVLTTEMRRLVAEDRGIWMGLRPGVVLDRHALQRLFSWI